MTMAWNKINIFYIQVISKRELISRNRDTMVKRFLCNKFDRHTSQKYEDALFVFQTTETTSACCQGHCLCNMFNLDI